MRLAQGEPCRAVRVPAKGLRQGNRLILFRRPGRMRLRKRSTRGRPRTTDMRVVADALPCIAETGCQWRHLPDNFPFFTTIQYYFHLWRDSGAHAVGGSGGAADE